MGLSILSSRAFDRIPQGDRDILNRSENRNYARPLVILGACWLLALMTHPASAADPLHVRIDRLIEQGHVGPVASTATDAEFLRRISLDLTGVIPSSAAARAFLDDKSPNKRVALVDRLLTSPRHALHMANVFDVMLMERRAAKHVKAPEWQTYLTISFQQNKPFDQLAREILSADGDPKNRAPIRFYLDREGEPNLLTREVGRIFFGVDLQCAQCHDHPLIDDYLQADYYGMSAFLNRGFVFQPDKKKPALFAEKAEGNTSFKSVFTEEAGTTRPRLPGGVEIDEPAFPIGDEYTVKAAKNVRPIPRFSRRAKLAELATNGSSQTFNRNVVNRLWMHMLGRGLVHPVDLHHSDNPPSHPELLNLLASEFPAMKFDIRAFLREIALTQTYQRSFAMPVDLTKHIALATATLPNLEAEHKRLEAAYEATGKVIEAARAAVNIADEAAKPLRAETTKSNAAVTAAVKAADTARKPITDAEAKLATKQPLATSLTEAAAKTTEAAKRLPADKELAQIAAKLDVRAKQLITEVATLTKTIATRRPALQAAEVKVAAAHKVAAASDAKAAPFEAKLLAARRTLQTTIRNANAQRTLAKVAELKLARAKVFVDYSQRLAAVSQTQAALAKAKTDLQAATNAIPATAALLAKAKAIMPATQKATTDATAQLTQANTKLTAASNVAKLVQDAAAKAEQARASLPQDAQFLQAIATLKSRATTLSKQTEEAKKVVTARQATVTTAKTQLATAQKSVTDATAKVAAAQKQVADFKTRINTINGQIEAAHTAVDQSHVLVTKEWTKYFATASLESLTPEQMAWSTLQATGLIVRQLTAEQAAINKKTPLKPEEQKDAAKLAARRTQVQQAAYAKLKGNVGNFVRLFGAGAGQPQQDFFATVDQALFFSNGNEVRSWLAPSGTNLTARLVKLEEPKALTEELFLSILTRRPADSEVADVTQYLAARPKDRSAAIQEIVWALLTSTEFRFAH